MITTCYALSGMRAITRIYSVHSATDQEVWRALDFLTSLGTSCTKMGLEKAKIFLIVSNFYSIHSRNGFSHK